MTCEKYEQDTLHLDNSMKVTVKTFAQIREITQESNVDITLPEGIRTIADVIALLRARNSKWAFAFEGSVLMALNQQLCDAQARIQENDEIAFFPPVTGG